MKLSRAHRHPPTHPRTHPRNRSFRLGRQRGRRLRLGSLRALGRRERRRSPPLRPRWSKTAASSSSSPAACAGFLWHRSDLSILIGSRPTRELFEPESQVDQGNDIATHTGRQSGRQAGRQAGRQGWDGSFMVVADESALVCFLMLLCSDVASKVTGTITSNIPLGHHRHGTDDADFDEDDGLPVVNNGAPGKGSGGAAGDAAAAAARPGGEAATLE